MSVWQRQLGLDLEIPDDFGHWLAGFTDGEGCFNIKYYRKANGTFQCSFSIGLREDDSETLYMIQEILGIGQIYSLKNIKKRSSPSMTWIVTRIGDVIHVIIPIFEKYPLRAKKRRDFMVWSRAARIIQAGLHLKREGKEELIKLKQELEEGRKYIEQEGSNDRA